MFSPPPKQSSTVLLVNLDYILDNLDTGDSHSIDNMHIEVSQANYEEIADKCNLEVNYNDTHMEVTQVQDDEIAHKRVYVC